ncbi:MAG TPA: PAS domain S-box protein [Nitrospira sp.]
MSGHFDAPSQANAGWNSITEQERDSVESALRESERRFQWLYDNNPSMYFTLLPQGTVCSVNKYGAEHLGYQPDELIGRSILTVFKPQDHETVLQQLKACATNADRLFEWEIEKVRKNGTALWVKERAQAIHDRTGRTVVLVVCEDVTARRLTEQVVQEIEDRWRALFEHAGVGMAQLSLSGQFLRVNPRLCETFGYSSRTMLHLTLQDLTHPDDLPSAIESLRILATGTHPSFSMEKRCRRSDDTWIWINQTVSVVRTASSVPAYFIAVVEDVSERKRSEVALRESEERYGKAFRSSPHPVVVTELETGRCLEVNDAGLRLFGFQRDEVIGRTTTALGLWPALGDRQRFFDRLTAEGSVRNLEATFQAKDGSPRQCLMSCEMIVLNGTLCLVTVGTDITEQKRAENALRLSELRLHHFVSEAPVGLVILDDQRRVLVANKSFCQLTGYDEQELIGNAYDMYTHPDDRAGNLALTEQFYRGERHEYTLEKRYVRKGGDTVWVSMKATHMELPSHPGPLLLAVVQDITDQRRATEERERLSQDLHDNILQSLYAVGMQLEASKLAADKSVRKAKLHASQAVNQLNQLVADVRHFIALLKRGTSPQKDFCGALHQLVSAFSAAGHRPPELDIKEGVLNLIGPAQAEQLLNIAREALSNSVRHAQATHRSIRLSRFGHTVRMQICDDGVGFVPKLKRKQGHGLMNMAARAKKIGARLRLTSKPDQGTCITVDLATEKPI